MLILTLKTPFTNRAFSYLRVPDINDNMWKARGKDEIMVVLCDKEIILTEELKIYLNCFSQTCDKNISHTLTSFSNLPVKEA